METVASPRPVDEAWWHRCKASLKAAWPSFPWNDATFALYKAALVRHDTDQIQEAIQELIIDHEFAPPVAAIVKQILTIQHNAAANRVGDHETTDAEVAERLDVERAMREAAKESVFVGLLLRLVRLRLDKRIEQHELTALTIGPPHAPRKHINGKAGAQQIADIQACLARFPGA